MKDCPICNNKLIESPTNKYECPEVSKPNPSHEFEIWGFGSKNECEMWQYKGYLVSRRPSNLSPTMPLVDISRIGDLKLSNSVKTYAYQVSDIEIKDFIDGLAN